MGCLSALRNACGFRKSEREEGEGRHRGQRCPAARLCGLALTRGSSARAAEMGRRRPARGAGTCHIEVETDRADAARESDTRIARTTTAPSAQGCAGGGRPCPPIAATPLPLPAPATAVRAEGSPPGAHRPLLVDEIDRAERVILHARAEHEPARGKQGFLLKKPPATAGLCLTPSGLVRARVQGPGLTRRDVHAVNSVRMPRIFRGRQTGGF